MNLGFEVIYPRGLTMSKDFILEFPTMNTIILMIGSWWLHLWRNQNKSYELFEEKDT